MRSPLLPARFPFDVPVLQEALRGKARHIGELGSRRTHSDRLRRLREVGMSDVDLARLHSPIGLDPCANSPEETAVSFAAEIVLTRTHATARAFATPRAPSTPDGPEGGEWCRMVGLVRVVLCSAGP